MVLLLVLSILFSLDCLFGSNLFHCLFRGTLNTLSIDLSFYLIALFRVLNLNPFLSWLQLVHCLPSDPWI